MAQLARRPQVLLVDDDSQETVLFAHMLRLGGYDVQAANDFSAARACLEQQRFDAMLVDFHMPEMDGLAFVRELRTTAAGGRTAVAIVTGDYALDSAVSREAVALGVPVVFKPLWCEDLIELVASLLADRTNGRHGAAAEPSAGSGASPEIESNRAGLPQRISPPSQRATGRTVMVVDDDRDARAMMMQLLELAGFQTDAAANGVEALAKLGAARTMPDLILLDLMMPVMDGRTLKSHLQRDPRLSGIPVVVLSSVANDSRLDDVAAILCKPCDPDRLLFILHGACLRQRRQPNTGGAH